MHLAVISPMVWTALAAVAVGLLIAAPLTAVLVRIGRKVNAMDSAGTAGHQKELRAVPNIGGIAIFAAVVPPMLVGLLLLRMLDAETIRSIAPMLSDDLLARIAESTPTALALLICLTALHVMGLLDDRRGLGAWPKLLIQFAAAATMTIWFDVRLFEFAGDVVSIVVTIAWLIAITNAINFMDNMDGLAAGVSAIAAGLFMAAALVNAQWFIAGTLGLLIGGLVGFLIFNFPPAKIFMGDGGSLVVGFLLAVLTARTTYYNPDVEAEALGGGWYAVFMPVVVLAVPLYDLLTVTLIRLRQGSSPFVGDQQHFSHRLVQRGLSKRGAVVVIWGATMVTGVGGISLGQLQGWQAILVGVQTLLVLLVIAIFEHASRTRPEHEGEA